VLFWCLQGDEWEEKWGEHYHNSGKVAKFADKWGKAGEATSIHILSMHTTSQCT
jgi:hypothetical protein